MLIIKLMNSGCPTPEWGPCTVAWVRDPGNSLWNGFFFQLESFRVEESLFHQWGFLSPALNFLESFYSHSLEVYLCPAVKCHLIDEIKDQNDFWNAIIIKIITSAHMYRMLGPVLNASDFVFKNNLWRCCNHSGWEHQDSCSWWGHLATETLGPIWPQSLRSQSFAISLLRALTRMGRGIWPESGQGERGQCEQRPGGSHEPGV